MLALYRRMASGKGGHVSTSLMANGAWGNALSIQAVLSGGEVANRPARENASSAVNNFYQSKDGRWFHLIMITGQARFPELAAALGRPAIADDERFATEDDRLENTKALIGELDIAFGRLTAAEVRDALNAQGSPSGKPIRYPTSHMTSSIARVALFDATMIPEVAQNMSSIRRYSSRVKIRPSRRWRRH